MDRLTEESEIRLPRMLPRGIRLRRGIDSDEFPAFEVMRRAMGYDMTWSHHAAMRAHLRTSPECSFWVAEETPRFGKTRLIGYARSTIRERVWNLNEFFLHPDYQRKGIGGALLDCCIADGDRAGADTRYVLASQNAGADSLYVRRAGCIPRLPMLLLAGPLSDLHLFTREASVLDSLFSRVSAGREPQSATLYAEPLTPDPDTLETFTTLDREFIGYARPPEHVHWIQEMGGPRGAARSFRRLLPGANGSPQAGPIVGYAYLGPHSSGPILARDPNDLPRMLAHVVAVQRALTPTEHTAFFHTPTDHYLALPGTNAPMLRWLLDCRWQIIYHYLFMSSRPLGKLEHYICHNPLYTL